MKPDITGREAIALILWLILMLFPSEVTFCAWSSDPAVNTAVCTVTGDQTYPSIFPDGSGGAIITWADYRSYYGDIYAQRLDLNGNVLWTADGVVVCANLGNQVRPQLVSDGSGGAIITWQDKREGGNQSDIYAQRIDLNGNILWAVDGVLVSSATGDVYNPRLQLISDGSGGAIITWSYDKIYAQHLDSSGNTLWAVNGAQVSTATVSTPYSPEIISDGSGGAIVTWSDKSSGLDPNIYAQHIDSSGNPLWTSDGAPVCSAADNQWGHQLVSDGSGGCIITWQDRRNGNYDIYAQRMNSSGNPLWTLDGVPVCGEIGDQLWPQLFSDDSGGVIITWYDIRNGTDYNVYVQLLDSLGTSLWTPNGLPICMAPYSQGVLHIISDGAGGAIVTWQDQRSGGTISDADIYVQHVDSSGNAMWTADGVPVSTAPNDQVYPQMTSDGSGGAIITWYDRRSGTDPDIYAQHINSDGTLGTSLPLPPPPPIERAILVVPWYNDSGGSNLLASFITVFNSSSQTVIATVTYTGPGGVDATPSANTFTLGAQSAKAGRPFQVSGVGESIEQGPPWSMPNATSSAPFGSATFTAQVPIGYKIYGDTLRMGVIDLNQDGTGESFSGIAPAYSR